MSIVLGLHTGHDGSVCIVRDGRLVAALSAERITRSKKSAVVPEVLDAVLADARVTLDQIDAVAVTDWYSPWSHGIADCYVVKGDFTDPNDFPLKPGDWIHDSWNRIYDDEVWEMEVVIRGKRFPGYNIAHQKAHCASAYYTSPFKQAWCVSMDSSGARPKNNFMVARGEGNQLKAVPSDLCLAGVLYGHVCDKLEIGAQLFKAGSLMALAAYGHGSDMSHKAGSSFFGADGDYHKWINSTWSEWSGGRTFTKETSDSQAAMDIAANVQSLFEHAILWAVDMVPDDGVRDFCLSGGSFLNCNANTQALNHRRVDNVHLFPGCGDDGCAIGAALYVAHAILGEPRLYYPNYNLAYLGPHRSMGPVNVERVARAIADGKVVGWFQGRSEYGPRALGHRSILADPRSSTMRDHINHNVKNREWYRPLSPSVLAEKSAEWFDFPRESPFMLHTAPCKRAEEVFAVVHVDGSARMQTVRRSDNPNYYDLIKAFDELTDVPMVLNTSLNVDGQPILETEDDAREMWGRGVLDMMVVGGEIWER